MVRVLRSVLTISDFYLNAAQVCRELKEEKKQVVDQVSGFSYYQNCFAPEPVRANNYSPLHPRSLNLEPLNLDGTVKSRKCNKMAIPAKAGINEFQFVPKHWTPVFTGVTAFYGFISIDTLLNRI